MGKKYIVNPPENPKYILEICVDAKGEVKVYGDKIENFTPYTEPDLDAIRKEEYYKGFQAGSANTSLVITDNTIRERIEGAYQQGLEDAGNRKATCEFCEYAGNDESDEPCVRCCCGYINMFRPKGVVPKADSRIRKKIEGIMESLDCTISDFEKAIEEMKNEAD